MDREGGYRMAIRLPARILFFLGLLLSTWLALPTPDTALAETGPTAYRVGVLYWSMEIPGQVAMRRGLEARAEEINGQPGGPRLELVPRVAGEGQTGIENQIVQMNELLDLGLDLIIVQPTDNAALADPLRRANRQGVPVVAYDQYISGGELACYLTSDNYQAGYQDGEYAAWVLPDDRPATIVLVEYPHVSSTVERVDGFLDALGRAGQPYRIAAAFEAVEPVGGRRAGQEILRGFPEPGTLDLVFCVNDGGGLAVVDVLAEAGRTEIKVASIDGDPVSLENIRAGRLTIVDSAQFCWHLGAEAMQAAWEVLQGEPVADHLLLPVFPITAETIDSYGGWYGGTPDPFTKPWPSSEPVWT